MSKISEQQAVELLKASGYTVFKREFPDRFPCSNGHVHRSQSASDQCQKPKNCASEAVRLDSIDPVLRDQARSRYYDAYRSFQSGRRKCDIARDLGLSSTRADQIVRKGYRWALKEGWATVQP